MSRFYQRRQVRSCQPPSQGTQFKEIRRGIQKLGPLMLYQEAEQMLLEIERLFNQPEMRQRL